MHERRPVVRPVGSRMVACALLMFALACDSKPTPAPKSDAPSPLQPRGIEEMKRVRGDVEKANEAGLQRNDDAVDRAGDAELAGRGAPAR